MYYLVGGSSVGSQSAPFRRTVQKERLLYRKKTPLWLGYRVGGWVGKQVGSASGMVRTHLQQEDHHLVGISHPVCEKRGV